MPLPRRRRVTAALAAAFLLDAGFAVLTQVPSAGAASAPASTAAATTASSVATLHVGKKGVSVRRKGKTAFKLAKEGLKLRVGDTVQTDATGFAQINYTDDSFTRLDVNTTFTIVSLTDDQGNRKVNGSLDSGRTWNRTSALTQSESFEQQGGGATAAVVGSAYIVEKDAEGHFIFISVVDGLKLTTVDGEVKILNPLEECDSTDVTVDNADLCAVPAQVTEEVLLANQWLMLNLLLDGIAGLPGPDVPIGTVTVDNGVVTFTPAPPPPPPDNPPDNPPSNPPAAVAPTVNRTNPICVDNGTTSFSAAAAACQNPSAGSTFEGQPGITTSDDTSVAFLLNGSSPDGSAFYFLIKTLPVTPLLGLLYATRPHSTIAPADTSTHYEPATIFTYTPNPADDDRADPTTTDTFTYQAVNASDATKTSDTAEVDITVHEPSEDT